MLLENKNAVIYGGGESIGGAVAREFARGGARIFLAGRTQGRLRHRARHRASRSYGAARPSGSARPGCGRHAALRRAVLQQEAANREPDRASQERRNPAATHRQCYRRVARGTNLTPGSLDEVEREKSPMKLRKAGGSLPADLPFGGCRIIPSRRTIECDTTAAKDDEGVAAREESARRRSDNDGIEKTR
jgi:hypothetical protein